MDFTLINKKIEDGYFECSFLYKKNASNAVKRYIKRKFDTFDDFVDVSHLDDKTTFDFLFRSEDNKAIKVLLVRIIHNSLHLDTEEGNKYVFDYYYKKDFKQYSKQFNIKENTELRKFYRYLVKTIVWLFVLNSVNFENDFQTENSVDFYQYLSSLENGNYYYRGQSNSEWDLTPSILRNFKYSMADGCVIDKKRLFYMYDKINLIKKYNLTMGNDNIKNYKDINYDFLSLMQHSVSYSPLIDFTENYHVAYSFALNKGDPNNYLYSNSAIYILNGNNISNTDITLNDNFKIIFLNKKIKPGTKMHIIDSNNNKILIDFTTPSKIVNSLKPKVRVLNTYANDRMKYQKGLFVIFYDCVSVKGRIYYSLCDGIHFYKHIVKQKAKDTIYKKNMRSMPELKISYLMNPYQIFNE